MTIYINHNNPAKYRDLQMQLIQAGIAEQQTAMNVAQQIIDYRQTTWGGHNFVHLGA